MEQTFLVIYSTVTPLLFVGLIFFVVRLIKTIDRLDKTVSKITVGISVSDAKCLEKHRALDESIKQNSRDVSMITNKIDDHEHRLTIVETKIK